MICRMANLPFSAPALRAEEPAPFIGNSSNSNRDFFEILVALLSELGTLRRFIDFFLLSDACLTTQPEQLSFYCMLPEIARGRFIPLRPPAFLPRKQANHSYPMVNLYPLTDALCDHIPQFFLIFRVQVHAICVARMNILRRIQIFTVIHTRQRLIPSG